MSGIDPQWIDAASSSDVGRVRSVNQDSFAEFEDGRGSRLLVVADGMGGHQGGETASRLAVEAIGDVFTRSEGTLERRMNLAIEMANERVYRSAGADSALAGMGTTVVALCLGEGGEAWVVHVGDSRLYRLRDGRLDALTADHSLVAEMQREGFLSAEEARVHPRRNELTRSVGVAPGVEAEISRIAVAPGDRFLLCSDGLCGYLEDEEIREVLACERPPNAARILVDQANAKGGYDNVTVQVVAIPDTARLAGGAGGQTEILQSPRRAGGVGGQTEVLPPSSKRHAKGRLHASRPGRRAHRLILAGSAASVLLLAAAALWLLLRG
jgi:serine/threonine protein phosphatase PrpC